MAIAWTDYCLLMGLFLGAGGIGMAYGQFMLGIKQTLESVGA